MTDLNWDDIDAIEMAAAKRNSAGKKTMAVKNAKAAKAGDAAKAKVGAGVGAIRTPDVQEPASQILTHLDKNGSAHMVDVGAKDETARVAIAEGFIAMNHKTLALIVDGEAPKGDVLAAARIAGIMASKQTSALIPLCHPLNITSASIELSPVFSGERKDACVGVHVQATIRVQGKTGIEMEALTAASVACLTIYDMCKAVDRGMEISQIRLIHKSGGKSGTWERS